MRVIILAAGCGRRMNPLTNSIPKCLLPINNETILERLINQLKKNSIDSITVVVGYKKEKIFDAVGSQYDSIKFIVNDMFYEDVNILSLSLALQQDLTPFYLFEADCIFENRCFNLIFDPSTRKKSIWFSKGFLKEEQYGGIIKSNESGEVVDIKIIEKYEKSYKNYRKMIGIMKVGEKELNRYSNYLFEACDKSINQFYHIPWINNQDKLKSHLCDFKDLKVTSINTIGDYSKAQEMFKNEAD